MPATAGVQVQLDHGSLGCADSVLMRIRPDEGPKDVGQEAIVFAGDPDRVADVALMNPSLGEVTGDVEPAWHLAVRSPDHAARVGELEASEVGVDLAARPLQQIHHDPLAQPACAADPRPVLRIEGGDELAVVTG